MNGSEHSLFSSDNKNQVDEHDEPTEPMRYTGVSPSEPTVPNDEPTIADPVNSPTQPHGYASPQQQVPPSPPYPVLPRTPLDGGAYPYLPSAPVVPDVSRPTRSISSSRIMRTLPIPRLRIQKTLIPLCVGLFFVALQVLLLVRFGLKLFSLPAATAWVSVVYGASDVLVLPFHLLFLQFNIPDLFGVELYTLLAVLVYGMVSRVIVRVLKATIKNTR